MTGPEQFMRMGYGRINYFPNMRNNWNVADSAIAIPVHCRRLTHPPRATSGVSSAGCVRLLLTTRRSLQHQILRGKTSSTGCSRSTVWDPRRIAKHCTQRVSTSREPIPKVRGVHFREAATNRL